MVAVLRTCCCFILPIRHVTFYHFEYRGIDLLTSEMTKQQYNTNVSAMVIVFSWLVLGRLESIDPPRTSIAPEVFLGCVMWVVVLPSTVKPLVSPVYTVYTTANQIYTWYIYLLSLLTCMWGNCKVLSFSYKNLEFRWQFDLYFNIITCLSIIFCQWYWMATFKAVFVEF